MVTETQTRTALDHESCYRAVSSRDVRFDGVFYTAVASTGIYCRPSCPARTPARRNVSFHPTAAAAQQAGYRACKRCRPDATPGSPEWDLTGGVAGRAMRMIADGVVDRDGVSGLAGRLGYSPRHLTRLLTAQLGAGPLAQARAQRAHTARILIETTDLAISEIAFASGFDSIRQFNTTIRQVYGVAPSQLRGRRTSPGPSGELHLRLAVRQPFDGAALLAFLTPRTVTGVESVEGSSYRRTIRLPHGPAAVEVDLSRPDHVPATFVLSDVRDLPPAVERTRRLLDADADPVAVDAVLGADRLLAASVTAHPGLRVPGHVDGDELAVRAILGQQVSVAGARTTLGRLVLAYGEAFEPGWDGLTRLFPTAAALAAVDPQSLPLPRTRAGALHEVTSALATERIRLDRGADRDEVRTHLLAVPGIGPWTCDYIALRGLGDPDVWLPSDLGTRRGLQRLSAPSSTAVETNWRPWRSYAQLHLWTSLMTGA